MKVDGMKKSLKICINCDDFGLSPQIDQGIIELASRGMVGSCSAFANLSNNSSLKKLCDEGVTEIGLHFDLTSNNTSFFKNLITCLKTRPQEVRQQLEEQFNTLTGKLNTPPSFLDAHQNIQIFPHIRKVMLDFAKERELRFIRIPKEISFRRSWKKFFYNLILYSETSALTFWGISFMGDSFTKRNILKQLNYLKEQGLKHSIWAIHPGHRTPEKFFSDSYNLEREQELKLLLSMENDLREEAELVSLGEILV